MSKDNPVEVRQGLAHRMMWFSPFTGAKSARGADLRICAEKGHFDWSELISL